MVETPEKSPNTNFDKNLNQIDENIMNQPTLKLVYAL